MSEELKTSVGPEGEEMKTSMHQDKLPIRNIRVGGIHERLQRSSNDEPQGEDLIKSL